MKGFALLAAMVITYAVALLPSNSLAEEAKAQKAVLIFPQDFGHEVKLLPQITSVSYVQ
jgi:hypothetical protein